ncbi:TIGR02281 family clan AA aspartic protease [Methylobacillus flagellatus]|uniref:retropepsin-like aspartic protease family protein n=1 Tax=Methylobacillus flagellatus TaxID=405 RepID=UPI002853E002|nr:TIGR02281 family clan AA aspartic protease [Methylobacillus flagellatus]MDR5172469.1 TIGR02281 family clan AA aspartic protease [Methylobacillus flagellatus]
MRILMWVLPWLLPSLAWAETQVNIVGLFQGKAIVVVNGGKPRTLSAGEMSPEGIRLVSASSDKAVIEVDGFKRELGMGQAIALPSKDAAAGGSVTLYADSTGHHFVEGQINGASLRFLVDTGASAIVMNSGDAKYAKIDYKRGIPVSVQTANGVANAYKVVINHVRLNGLVLSQVDGLVMEGGSPAVVLLGMSALNRMEMKREGIALTLTKKY